MVRMKQVSWRDDKAMMSQEETGEVVADEWVRKLIPETRWLVDKQGWQSMRNVYCERVGEIGRLSGIK